MSVAIVRTAWAGTSGGPGLTQTAFNTGDFGPVSAGQAQTAVDAVRAWWQALITLLPDELVLTVSPVVDWYDHGTGTLQGSVSAATPPASVAGTSAAVFSMASGVKANLNTVTIANGRRVRGAIYIVPAASTTMNTTGGVLSTARTTINTAGNTMRTAFTAASMQLCVWSRPLKDAEGNIERLGTLSPVTGVEANEKVAVLRGRRD